MKKLSLYTFLVLMVCNVGFAKDFINCSNDEIKDLDIIKLFKYVGYDDDNFYLYYETRLFPKRFILDVAIDKDFSSDVKLESEHFDTSVIDSGSIRRYIILDKSDNSLSVYNQFNERQFLFRCKKISRVKLLLVK